MKKFTRYGKKLSKLIGMVLTIGIVPLAGAGTETKETVLPESNTTEEKKEKGLALLQQSLPLTIVASVINQKAWDLTVNEELPAGSTINLAKSGTVGVYASGVNGEITDVKLSTTPTLTKATDINGQTGIHVNDGGSVLVDNSMITLGADIKSMSGITGIKADTSGKINFSRGLINIETSTGGKSNYGVVASNAAAVDLSSSNITVNSASSLASPSTGILASSGAQVTLQDNVIVSTLGGYNHGLVVTGENTAATVNNSKITATGSYSNAIKAQDKATVELSGSEILAGGGASTTNPTAALYGTDGATLKVKDNSTLTALGIASHGVFLSGEGSQLEFEDSSVSIAGKQAYAITLKEGATASIKKGTVVVDSDDKSTNGSAIFVDGQKSAAKVVDTSIYTSGKSNYGIRTLNGAHAEMQSGSIKTEGEHAVGLYATGVAGQSISSITAEHITIETSGEGGAYGAVANNYSRVKLNDVTIITKGSGVSSVESGGHGLSARMSDAILEATNATIQTSGVRAYGAAVDDGGQITLLNSSVTTQGEYSTGLYNGVDPQGTEDTTLVVKNTSVITSGHLGHGASVAQSDKDAKAFLSISQSTISTRGDDSHGLNVVSGGQLFFSESQATTEGKNSYGIHIKKSNTGTAIKESVARIENSFIETLGENAHAAGLFQGGTLDLEKSFLSAQGAGSSALMINTLEGQSAQVNVENSQLINKNSAVINVLGKADISFTGSIISGDDHWLSVGETDDLSSQANSHASIKLSNSQADGATAKAALSDSSLTLSENSVWNMSGDSDLSTLINSHSFVNFSAPGDNGYKTLTVNHYHGDNGVVSLNTHLYDDASPSDKIVIDGGVADGKTSLLINNTGGAGALTRGNGIKVVDAINDGTTTSDAFSLQKKVKAGPYEYTLHRSGVKGSDDEAWFLRSTRDFHKPGEDIVIPPPPDPDPGTGPVKEPEKDPVKDPGKGTETDPGKNTGGDPVRPVEPVTPAKPVTSPAKGDVIPNYRAETSLYQDIPQLALRYSRMLVDTLHERVGEEAQVQQDNIQDNEDTSMSWGRVIYKDGRSARDGMKSDFRLSAIQLGIDLYRQQNGDGSKSQAGISGSLGRITSDVKHTDNSVAGGNTLKAWGLGGYWTYFTPSGAYLDSVLQYNRFSVESQPLDLESLKTHGYGLTASLETGYPFQPDNAVLRFIEPQAQLIYSSVRLSDAHDAVSDVKFSKAESLTGRLGVRMHEVWDHDDKLKKEQSTSSTTGWVRPSLWHEFKGKTQTEFSSENGYVPFTTKSTRAWGELNAGVDHKFNASTSVHGSLSYQKSLDGKDESYGAILGIKIKF